MWKVISAATLVTARAAALAAAQDVSFGERLFQDKADCAFCHGPQGDGRGDPRSPGKAANLRTTILKREHLIEVITCGRPRTEMPHLTNMPMRIRHVMVSPRHRSATTSRRRTPAAAIS